MLRNSETLQLKTLQIRGVVRIWGRPISSKLHLYMFQLGHHSYQNKINSTTIIFFFFWKQLDHQITTQQKCTLFYEDTNVFHEFMHPFLSKINNLFSVISSPKKYSKFKICTMIFFFLQCLKRQGFFICCTWINFLESESFFFFLKRHFLLKQLA